VDHGPDISIVLGDFDFIVHDPLHHPVRIDEK
jgi:hypothetical protein